MAGAVLLGTIESNTLRKNFLTLTIDKLQSQKLMAVYSQRDVRAFQAQDESEVRAYYKALFDENAEYNGKYADYTEIPDFEEEMDKIAAYYQDQLDELASWETHLETEITTASAEIEEIKAYNESFKSMLTSNIQNDYNFAQS